MHPSTDKKAQGFLKCSKFETEPSSIYILSGLILSKGEEEMVSGGRFFFQ